MPRAVEAQSLNYWTSREVRGCLFFVFNDFIYLCLFLAVLGLCCCVGFSLVAASRGHSLVEVPRLRAQAQKFCFTDLVAPLRVGLN